MRPQRRTDFGKPLTPVERLLMFLVYWLGTFCYRLLCSTYRVRILGPEHYASARNMRGGAGLCWHQRLFCVPYLVRKVPRMAFLVSQSKDGEMIRYVLEGLGYKGIQGSSSRRGGVAYREMLAHLACGGNIGVTPDGPRGPARRVQAGIPRLALERGLVHFPVAISARAFWLAPSWDRFLFPRPFTRIVFFWGEPVRIEPGTGPEAEREATRLLEEALDRVTELADRAAGHDPLPRGRTEPRG